MRQVPLLAVTLCAAAFATSGCGSSSKSTSLTKSELIAKADAICAHVHHEYHAHGYTTAASIARQAPLVAAAEQAGVNEMHKLTPPASMAADWNKVIAGAQTVASDTATLAKYAKEGNRKAMTSLFATGLGSQQQALAVAARDGFGDCAKAS
jgi:hypothetical protein